MVKQQSSMYHTFQGLAPPQPASRLAPQAPKTAANGTAKRITTPHACAECKRRKIRCDGRQPCGQCLGCRSPKPCYYDKHRQRVIPSRKTLDGLSQSLEECRSILKRLFPTRDARSLLALSRQELIGLLDRPSGQNPAPQASPTLSHARTSQTSPASQDFHSPQGTVSDDDRSFANLAMMPSRDVEWDEERRNRDPIPIESDDVNALSLSVDRPSSYVGASSIKAAFLVMLKVAPVLKTFLTPAGPGCGPNKHGYGGGGGGINGNGNGNGNGGGGGLGGLNHHPSPQHSSLLPHRPPARVVAWSSQGQTLIDAYFNRVHLFVPMLDEPSFRATYLASQRSDAPWLAVLNMVFAMGSIVAMKSDDDGHALYYARAKEQLDLDTFGNGQIESLQAMGIMGGYYLHYINRPNMAYAIMGAALRTATALGLHRQSFGPESGRLENNNSIPDDLRRRTWWSLFCLDTWASTTLGRPSLGRWGPAITIRSPEGNNDFSAQNIQVLPLIENIKFCKIATQVQDILAISPLPRVEERVQLDAQLVEWYERLPYVLRSTEPCPEALCTARSVMKWRWQNLRMYLHRPVLLHLANRGHGRGVSSSSSAAGAGAGAGAGSGLLQLSSPPSEEEAAAVAKCRNIAAETIDDIARNWARNQMSGWNAVWFLYQAVMIPFVSIFWESGGGGGGGDGVSGAGGSSGGGGNESNSNVSNSNGNGSNSNGNGDNENEKGNGVKNEGDEGEGEGEGETKSSMEEDDDEQRERRERAAAVARWQGQIETVIALLTDMSDWSLAARRSCEVVTKMYEATWRPMPMPMPSSSATTTRPGSAGAMMTTTTTTTTTRQTSGLSGDNANANAGAAALGQEQQQEQQQQQQQQQPQQQQQLQQHQQLQLLQHQHYQHYQHQHQHQQHQQHQQQHQQMYDAPPPPQQQQQLDMEQQQQQQQQQCALMLEHQIIWDLDGMLWGTLPDGLDVMHYDASQQQMDFVDANGQVPPHDDANYMMYQ